MPRTNEDGKELHVLLNYVMERTVPAKEICGILGIKSYNTYLDRIKKDTYPNAEECRLLAEHFGLNPIELMVRFGLVTRDDVTKYAEKLSSK